MGGVAQTGPIGKGYQSPKIASLDSKLLVPKVVRVGAIPINYTHHTGGLQPLPPYIAVVLWGGGGSEKCKNLNLVLVLQVLSVALACAVFLFVSISGRGRM